MPVLPRRRLDQRVARLDAARTSRRRAACATPIRSLTEPPGFMNSHLPSSSHGRSRADPREPDHRRVAGSVENRIENRRTGARSASGASYTTSPVQNATTKTSRRFHYEFICDRHIVRPDEEPGLDPDHLLRRHARIRVAASTTASTHLAAVATPPAISKAAAACRTASRSTRTATTRCTSSISTRRRSSRSASSTRRTTTSSPISRSPPTTRSG